MNNIKNASFFDCANEADACREKIDFARAVLSEIMDYFELEEDREYIGMYAGQISNLLFIVADYLSTADGFLECVVSHLYEKHNSERANAKA